MRAEPPIVILAAGASTRMPATGDGGKLALTVLGRPLLGWTIGIVRDGTPHGNVLVVVKPSSPLRALVLDHGAEPAVAEDAALGMAHSLLAGLEVARTRATGTGAIVLLGDDPLAALALPDLLRALEIDAQTPAAIDRPGAPHPVYLPPAIVDEALASGTESGTADRGLRALLRADSSTRWLATHAPAPVDVDTPGDLQRLTASLQARFSARRS